MDGLSVASAIVGLTSLAIQLFDGCVKGFVLLSAAQGLGTRATILNCQLEWEHYNLYWWANTVGLFKEPPELNTSNPQLVEKTLRCLEQLLTDLKKIRENYRLDVAVTTDELNSLDVRGSYFGTHNFRGQPFMRDIARVYQKRASPWRKLKWATFDQDSFSQLVRDIHFFNEQLRNSLHQFDRDQCSNHTVEALEALVSTTTDKVVLDVVTDELHFSDELARASAFARRAQMAIDAWEGVNVKSNSISRAQASPAGSKLPSPLIPSSISECDLSLFESFDSNATQPLCSLHRAVYNGSNVFVEWKDVPTTRDRQLRHRVANIANLLATVQHTSFRSLRCIGYVKDSRAQRYGYIFQPPISGAVNARSLAVLLASGQWRPSLTVRIAIAAEVAGALRQLHNAGWLHKSMQSDNVQFFNSSWPIDLSMCELSDMYICGYSFARIDSPTEMTEGPAVDQLMYRHPLAADADRVPFCKAFDLYSLGCILLEIGLCRPLASILATHNVRKRQEDLCLLKDSLSSTQTLSSSSILEPSGVASNPPTLIDDLHTDDNDLAKDLRFAAGDCFLGVVRECLALGSSVDDKNHDEKVFEAEIGIYKQLSELHRTLQRQGN